MLPVRHVLAFVLTLVTLFMGGVTLAYVMHANSIPAFSALLTYAGITLGLVVGMRRYLRSFSSAAMRRHLKEIYRAVSRLSEGGCDMLIPHDDDRQTMRLIIMVADGAAVIEKQTWRGVSHRYSVYEDGRISRSILGERLSFADRWWLRRRLTPARLEYILQALRMYSPRQRVLAAS